MRKGQEDVVPTNANIADMFGMFSFVYLSFHLYNYWGAAFTDFRVLEFWIGRFQAFEFLDFPIPRFPQGAGEGTDG